MWCYTKVLIMKTDITKAFRCQQAISMGELCQKQSMDCSLWSWVISRWTLTLSRKPRMMMCWSNYKILLQIAPQRVHINILVGLACGMWPFMWRTAIPVNNVLKKGRTSFQVDVWSLSVLIGPGIPFWIFTSLLMNSEPFTLLFSTYLSVFLVTTKSDKRHVIILFIYIGDVIYHSIYKLLSSIIWIVISIHSNV